jgi:hypothetical protein
MVFRCNLAAWVPVPDLMAEKTKSLPQLMVAEAAALPLNEKRRLEKLASAANRSGSFSWRACARYDSFRVRIKVLGHSFRGLLSYQYGHCICFGTVRCGWYRKTKKTTLRVKTLGVPKKKYSIRFIILFANTDVSK